MKILSSSLTMATLVALTLPLWLTYGILFPYLNLSNLAWLQIWPSFWFSLRIAGIATILSLGLGLLTGVFMLYLSPQQRLVSQIFFSLCLVMPPVVVGFGFLQVFGPTSPIIQTLSSYRLGLSNYFYGSPALVATYTYYNLPLSSLVFSSRLAKIPAENFRLVEIYHLKNFSCWKNLYLPTIKRTAAFLFFFIFYLCFFEFNLASFLTVSFRPQPIAVAIYQALYLALDFPQTAALAAICLLPSLVFWVLFAKLVGEVYLISPAHERLPRLACPQWFGVILCCFGASLCLFLSLPFWATSFSRLDFQNLFGLPSFWSAMGFSLGLACLASTLAVTAILLWLYFLKSKLFRYLPYYYLGCPSVITGLAVFLMVKSQAWFYNFWGYFGLVALIQAYLWLPYCYLWMSEPFFLERERYKPLIQTLKIQGWVLFFKVDWPWLRTAALASFALSWAFSLGDLSVYNYLGKRFPTLSGLSVEAISHYRQAEANANNLLLITLCLLAFVLASLANWRLFSPTSHKT